MRSNLAERELLDRTRRALSATRTPLVLAVSGGCDSMVLLHAVVEVARERVAAVASFDHGTGPAARGATRLVRSVCRDLRVPVEAGGGRRLAASEATWRQARWAFLRSTAARHDGRVATAHTRDDQVETVLIRILRGAGVRGLAALAADTGIIRPFLMEERDAVRAYATRRGIPFVDDPSNDSRRYLRNRIRMDLLPALRRARPGIDEMLLDLAGRAGGVRAELDALARAASSVDRMGNLAVAAAETAGYSRESLAVLWPALAWRVGLALDRRGTERIVSFTIEGRAGARMQLSGGWEVHRSRDAFELVRSTGVRQTPRKLSPGRETVFDGWRFAAGADRPRDPWTAVLASDAENVVRAWRPGDRMVPADGSKPRRVKRFLSDARISGSRRARWPVVVSDGEVAWIPGVRRGCAATARPGRPEVAYACELDGGR